MYKVQNLINSPYTIQTDDGPKVIAARGVLDGVKLSAAQLSQIRTIGYFKIEAHESREPTEDEVKTVRRGRPPKAKTEE